MAPPDLTVTHEPATGGQPEAQQPLLADEAGQQLVVGDIPVAVPGFQSRDGLLSALDHADVRVSAICAESGLGGVGATQLAAAYARAKVAAGWPLVAWVSCADTDSLLAGLTAVADAVGLTDGDAGPGSADAAATVRPWLEADGDGCLLVFDDASDQEVLQAFVPARGRATVLITSTRPLAAVPGNALRIGAFSSAEAVAYLAEQTGRDDEAGAAEAAAVLGHLPLALALAAPIIAGQHAGYAWYLDRLQATSAGVPLTTDAGQPYPPGFARTVLLALQAVRAADRTGMCTRVMEIMSVLSPAGVRRELLYAAGQAGLLVSGRHRTAAGQVDRVLEWLSSRSLLTFSVDGQTVLVHRLVAQVIRAELSRRRRLIAVCEAAAFVLDVYSRWLAGSPDRRAVRAVPQHVTALLDSLAGPAGAADEELAGLLLRLRFVAFYHLVELGDSTPQAIAVGEPLAEELERLLGPDHPDTLNSRNSLAAAYLAAGRVADAIPLFEQTLAVRLRILGPGDPETLTSRNNLASAYQDAGQVAEAIRLYETNLEVREQLLGPDHPSTLNSQSNLAAAYRDAGRVAEAIPLLEQTLAVRERVLGPVHPDTRTSRKSLARAYQDAGRDSDAIPLLQENLAGRGRVVRPRRPDSDADRESPVRVSPAADRGPDTIRPARSAEARTNQPAPSAARKVPSTGIRRPPAEPPRRALPAGFRRPPADPARRPPRPSAARGPARLGDGTSPARDSSHDQQHDGEIVAAIRAGDPTGIAMAYDRYAADLYGYCHWKLPDPAEAAQALTDTFVVAAATLGDLPDPATLRPRLFALARGECRRRIRRNSATPDKEPEVIGREPDGARVAGAADATVQFAAVGREPDGARVAGAADATVQFAAVGREPDGARVAGAADATVQFAAVGREPDGARVAGAADATVQFAAVGREPDGARVAGAADATVQFAAVGREPDRGREPLDAAMPLLVAGLPTDATMPFPVIGQPLGDRVRAHGDQEDDELRSLIHAILAGLKPREREVIELSFAHDLNDDDLAIALDVSWSRAHTLAARARGQLEQALGALHIALTRRTACPVLGELLADWNGQLTEETRELVSWHIDECQTCAQHKWGALRPAAFSRLLPSFPLPPELREEVLTCCTSPDQDAVAHRRRVVSRAGSVWHARLSPAIRQLSWAGIKAHPGPVIAAVAVAVWVTAAVAVTLLTFGGLNAADAQAAGSHAPAAQATTGISPAAAARPATVRAVPSPSTSQPSAADSSRAYSSPTAQSASGPAPAPLASASAKPSKSPSPSPSHTASPSPSHTASPSPSQTASASPSGSPSASPAA